MNFDSNAYGPRVSRIFAEGRPGLVQLVAGATPDAGLLAEIEKPGLFGDSAAPAGALAGLWLYFDCFDEAHKVAQDDSSVEGSYWHAIAHRREPDYGNSSYWFQRVGQHRLYPSIHAAAQGLLVGSRAGFRLGARWDPQAFVEFCEEAAAAGPGSEGERFALAVERAEWELLFDYCARKRFV